MAGLWEAFLLPTSRDVKSADKWTVEVNSGVTTTPPGWVAGLWEACLLPGRDAGSALRIGFAGRRKAGQVYLGSYSAWLRVAGLWEAYLLPTSCDAGSAERIGFAGQRKAGQVYRGSFLRIRAQGYAKSKSAERQSRGHHYSVWLRVVRP